MKHTKILVIAFLAFLSSCGWNTLFAQQYSTQSKPLTFYSEELKQLQNKASQMDNPKMVKKDLDAILNLYMNHIRSHPNDKAHCLFQMGEYLINPANDELARPMEAFQNYQDALHSIKPSDSVSRGSVLYRMGQCYALQSYNIETALRYYMNSVNLIPYMAATLGDFYMFGWGVQQDLYLAATYYDISQRNGEPDAYESNFCIYYTIGRSNTNYADSMSIILFERFVYNQVINRNNAAAQSALMAAAQLKYPPAEYEMGERINNRIIDLPDMDAEEWYLMASHQGYAPALAPLAELQAKEGAKNAPNAQRYLKSLKEAEYNGSAATKFLLGKLYARGNNFGFPKKDLNTAAKYILTAYRISGSNEMLEAYKENKTKSNPTPEMKKEIIRWSDSAYNYYNIQCDTLFEMINRHPIYNTPRLNINNSYFQQNPNQLANINVNELDKTHAQHYLTAYSLYADLLKRMSLSDNSYESYLAQGGAYLQHRMKGLRERAEKMPVNLITKSLWEEWDGK